MAKTQIDAKCGKRSWIRGMPVTVFGTVLLFVTFTHSIFGGGSGFLFSYAPWALILLLLLFGSDPGPRVHVNKLPFLYLSLIFFLISLSVDGLQYSVVFAVIISLFLTLRLGPLIRDLPHFAYYAAILNLSLYYAEILLVGQFGLSFDPTIFNYAGAGRDEINTTWGFSRYSGHQSEPGYLASNLASLAVLSLLDGRRPGVFHWVCVATLASILSLTSILLAALLTLSNLIAIGLSPRRLVISVLSFAGVGMALLQILPMLDLAIVDYLVYRLQTRGGTDGSIIVKQLILADLNTRDGFSFWLGNRYYACEYCSYARSLGFGIYMLFQFGIFGGIALAILLWLAYHRLGRVGFALFLILSLSRAEFFFPSAIFIIMVIATSPPKFAEPTRSFGLSIALQRGLI